MEVPPVDLKLDIEPGSARQLLRGGDTTTTDMLMVPPTHIRIIEGYNLRVTGTRRWNERVREIADSIKANGFLKDEPLSCYAGKDEKGESRYYLIKGHCRMAALDLLNGEGETIPERVPVILKPPTTSAEDLTVDLFKTGNELTGYEKALGLKRLDSMGLTAEEIKKRVGISKRYGDELRALLALPRPIQKLLAEDRLSPTEAMAQVREKGQRAAVADIEAAASDQDETAKAAAKKAGAKGKAPAKDKKAAEGRVTRAQIERVAARKQPAERTPATAKEGRLTLEFKARPGDTTTAASIRPFENIFNGDWFDHGEVAGVVTIVRQVRFKIVAYRKPDAPAPAGPDTQGL